MGKFRRDQVQSHFYETERPFLSGPCRLLLISNKFWMERGGEGGEWEGEKRGGRVGGGD
jgi:hypothetical protein